MHQPWEFMKLSGVIAFWKQKAGEIKLPTYALYLASRDPRVPWYAKGFIAVIVAYAFSPIDLIPDFIPVIGYLDDLVVVPLGVFLAIRMIPGPVMAECRARAKDHLEKDNPSCRFMGAIVIGIWIIVIIVVGILVVNAIRR